MHRLLIYNLGSHLCKNMKNFILQIFFFNKKRPIKERKKKKLYLLGGCDISSIESRENGRWESQPSSPPPLGGSVCESRRPGGWWQDCRGLEGWDLRVGEIIWWKVWNPCGSYWQGSKGEREFVVTIRKRGTTYKFYTTLNRFFNF